MSQSSLPSLSLAKMLRKLAMKGMVHDETRLQIEGILDGLA